MSSKSQNVNFSNVKARDIKIDQTMNETDAISMPTTKDEFFSSVKKLISELQKATSEHTDIEEAIVELQALLEEMKKPNPEPSKIKRFLSSAKGMLVDLADTVKAAGVVTVGITTLLGAVKVIFGI